MIVWLASYPRSGNRLLRTILYKTMGLGTYSEYGNETFSGNRSSDDFQLMFEGDFNRFYIEATQSKQVYIVKTHALPRDNQPAIYITRDGRKSCLSYQYYHQANTPVPYPTLTDIVFGNDYFGSWSEHCRSWQSRGNILTLRYEDLINIAKDKLDELAQFIGYQGEVIGWDNDFHAQKQVAPHLVREGVATWNGSDPSWSQEIDFLFHKLHGKLMVELGYITEVEYMRRASEIPTGWCNIIDSSIEYLSLLKESRKIGDERLAIIDELKKICDERLGLINFLSH